MPKAAFSIPSSDAISLSSAGSDSSLICISLWAGWRDYDLLQQSCLIRQDCLL